MSTPPSPTNGLPLNTRWSLIARVREEDPEGPRHELHALIIAYWPALRAHLIHKKGIEADRAEDLLQGFVSDKILEKDLIAKADRRKGKFRTFLLTSLDRYVIGQHRWQTAAKRAPGRPIVDIDDHGDTANVKRPGPSDPSDVAWARTVVAQAIDLMKAECDQAGLDEVWGVFDARILGPLFREVKPVSYPKLIERYGFRSYAVATKTATKGKRMYAECVRSVVARFVIIADVDDEIAELRRILDEAGGG